MGEACNVALGRIYRPNFSVWLCRGIHAYNIKKDPAEKAESGVSRRGKPLAGILPE